MAIDLSNADHKKLDRMLDTILEWHRIGDISTGAARGALAHVFTAAAIDNASEVQSWLNPETIKLWKETADQFRTGGR